MLASSRFARFTAACLLSAGLCQSSVAQQFLTGLIYFDQSTPALDEQLNLVPEPLATLPEARIRPPASALGAILERFR